MRQKKQGREGDEMEQNCLHPNHPKSKNYHIQVVQGQSSLPKGAACIARLQAIWFLWFGLCLAPIFLPPMPSLSIPLFFVYEFGFTIPQHPAE